MDSPMDSLARGCRVCKILMRPCPSNCNMLDIFSTDQLVYKLGKLCSTSVPTRVELDKIDKSLWTEFIDSKLEIFEYFKKFPALGPLQSIRDLSRRNAELIRENEELRIQFNALSVELNDLKKQKNKTRQTRRQSSPASRDFETSYGEDRFETSYGEDFFDIGEPEDHAPPAFAAALPASAAAASSASAAVASSASALPASSASALPASSAAASSASAAATSSASAAATSSAAAAAPIRSASAAAPIRSASAAAPSRSASAAAPSRWQRGFALREPPSPMQRYGDDAEPRGRT